jgi:hypothetical protein
MEPSKNIQKVFIDYTFQVTQKELNDPETLSGFNMTLPDGRGARFMRITDWKEIRGEDAPGTSAKVPANSHQK